MWVFLIICNIKFNLRSVYDLVEIFQFDYTVHILYEVVLCRRDHKCVHAQAREPFQFFVPGILHVG